MLKKEAGKISDSINLQTSDMYAENIPAPKKKVSKNEQKVLLRLYRKGKITEEYLERFRINKNSFSYVYAQSRRNSLSCAESFYNALFISSLHRFDKSKKNVSQELAGTFSHPKGWYSDQYSIWRNNFWSRFVEVLQHIPRIHASVSKNISELPSNIRKSQHRGAVRMDNSFRFFVNICKALKKVLRHVLVICVAAFFAVMIKGTLDSKLALDVYLNGEYIGAVENSDMLTKAKKQLEKNISTTLGTTFRFNNDISFSFVHNDSHDYLSESELYSALYSAAKETIRPAYGLYVDDVLVVASENKVALEQAVKDINEFYSKSSELYDDDTSVKYSNSIAIVPHDFPTDILLDGDGIREALGLAPEIEEEKKEFSVYAIYYETIVKPLEKIKSTWTIKQNLTGIASPVTNADEPDLIVPETLTSSAQVGVTLDYIIVKRETVEEEYDYEIEYIETDTLLEGTQKIDTLGRDGLRKATYEISYENDEEISRELVEQEILKPAQNRIIYVGTRVPSAEEMATVATGTFIIPYQNYLSSSYGMRRVKEFGTREFHNAWDIPGPYGSPIKASDSGVVKSVNRTSGYGIHVIIDHENGYETVYAHLSSAQVKKGQRVSQGQVIAKMGATGRVTGVHVHFEIRKDGVSVDPEQFLGYVEEKY